MKKPLPYLLIILLCLWYSPANAQSAAQSVVTLNFQEILAIEIKDRNVILEMNKVSDYVQGSSVEMKDHIFVTSFPKSVGGYVVEVQASSEYFSAVPNGIPVNTVLIEAVGSTTGSAVLQSANPTELLGSTETAILEPYDIKYSIPVQQTEKYLNRVPGTYTTTVTYTIMPY